MRKFDDGIILWSSQPDEGYVYYMGEKRMDIVECIYIYI